MAGGSPTILVWLVNRSPANAPIKLDLKPLSGAPRVSMSLRSMVEGEGNKETDRAEVKVEAQSSTLVANRGLVAISVPPRSINILELTAAVN